MFSVMPHRDRTMHYARLTQIDPIQVWINAERRLMGLQTASRALVHNEKLRDRDPAALAFR
ncbi:hypothetical protein [Bradyrhizobium sp. LB11.1]|jgi:hypothetical protein|uniref:hypothetical protein n=1 Tax=Bradyrhizobium sp. LB11.1 TaxID=3156326 RepID=UPI00339A1B42